MTDADRHRLAAYLRALADRMGLKDWAVEVLTEPAEDGTHAQISCIDGRKRAHVRFDRDWQEQTPETLRQTCCHEMIHCHAAALRDELGRRLGGANFATADMLAEYMIDGIADALAPYMPLMLTNPIEETPQVGRQRPKPAEVEKLPEPKPRGKPRGKPSKKGPGSP